MAGDKNQDELAGAWEQSLLTEQGDVEMEDAAEAWSPSVAAQLDLGSDRMLNQEEIDNLLGFTLDETALGGAGGIRAIVDSSIVSYERLPMLEIVFDRLVRLLTVSLRNFFSDNVEITLDRITSVRFGDYVSSIPLPAILSVFKVEEWENNGLVFVDSNLIYLIIDVLLGGKRGSSHVKMDGRPYTTIEINLVRRMLDVVLMDAAEAFAPLAPVTFTMDRIETNPRFASITRPANAAILVELRLDMEGRGGTIEILLPYATIEPIRDLLLQSFMGEKLGRDPTWEGHLATEVFDATLELEAVLHQTELPLRQIVNLKKGDTILFDIKTDPIVQMRCGEQHLTNGRLGRIGDNIAIQVVSPLIRSRTTMAVFEQGGTGRNS
ncbi:MAG: flagellar motor switch protein FliM [Beijerinckiaceae bacterium]